MDDDIMRILFISNLYPPHDLGGWEQNCQEIVGQLRQRGHNCYILTSRFGVEKPTSQEEGVARTLHLQADIHYYNPLDFFLYHSSQDRGNKKALRDAFLAARPDVIFIWGLWNLSTQVAYWAEQWLPGRVAYAVAGYWLIEPDVHTAYWQLSANSLYTEKLKSLARRLALKVLARDKRLHSLELKHVACVSEYVRRKLLDANQLPHGACVIHNGIDPKPFVAAREAQTKRQTDRLHLMYVGGILPHKGVHTAVEALGLLHRQGKADELHLTLIGGGHPDYEAYLRQQVDESKLSDIVTFYGRVPRDKIPDLLGSADVFLFTSIWEEPIARSVMEAMAAGLVVVGTPVGGQPEMLEHGVNALVYPADDAAQLADCILQLLQQPALMTQLAEAGQKTVLERFTLERMVDEMEDWLKEIAV